LKQIKYIKPVNGLITLGLVANPIFRSCLAVWQNRK